MKSLYITLDILSAAIYNYPLTPLLRLSLTKYYTYPAITCVFSTVSTPNNSFNDLNIFTLCSNSYVPNALYISYIFT